MSRLLAITVLAACSHHDPAPAPPVPAAPSEASTTRSEPADEYPCEAVAASILKTRTDGVDPNVAKEVIVRHCTRDGWPADFRRCVARNAADPACDAKLGEPQHDAYGKDMASHGVTIARPAHAQ